MTTSRYVVKLSVVVALSSLLLAGGLPSGPWVEIGQLGAAEVGCGGGFGLAMSRDGDRLAVGEQQDEIEPGVFAGSVYIFELQDGEWVEQARLNASDPEDGSRFGKRVALQGDVIAVGAETATVAGAVHQGAAYVFTFDGSEWTEQRKLVASDGLKQEFFGSSIALDQGLIVVGAIGADIKAADNQGAAYVFEKVGTMWVETQKLVVLDGQPADLFGDPARLKGNTLMIGASSATVNGLDSGAVYHFERDEGGVWQETQRLLASDDQGRAFGWSLAFEGDLAVIGDDESMEGDGSQGSAYIFRRVNGVWAEEQRLTSGEGPEGRRFGLYTGVRAGRVFVTGEFDTDLKNSRGAIYSYRWDGSQWAFEQKIVASDGFGLDGFGRALELEGSIMLTNATPLQDPAVYEFHLEPLFPDGFESGDTSRWSRQAGLGTE